MSNEDFTNLWKKQQSDGKPKASIIGGLQKLVEDKDAEILQLKEENIKLKERMNEDIEILSQSEQTIKSLQKKIDDYALKLEEVQTQLNLQGKGDKGDIFKTTTSVSAPKVLSESEEVKKLKMQVKSLEDKLYVFSTLPDRIATLEEQKSKDVALIEELESRERDLRKKLKEASDKDSALNTIEKLELKIQQLTKENSNLVIKLEQMENDSMAPKSKTVSESIESIDSPWKTRYEKAREQYEKLLSTNQQLNEELDSAKNTIIELKGSLKDTSSSDTEIKELKAQINDLKVNLSKANTTISTLTSEREDLLGKVSLLQRQSTSGELQDKLEKLNKENDVFKQKIKESDKKFEDLLFKFQEREQSTEKVIVEKVVEKVIEKPVESPNQNIIQDLQTKLERERAKNSDLSNQIQQLNEKLSKSSETAIKQPPPPKLPPGSTPQSSVVVDGLVEELQQKLEKQKKIIKKLTDENESLSSMKNKLEDLSKLTSENTELKNKVDELLKKVEIKANQPELKEITQRDMGDNEINKLSVELNELKHENLQLKEKLSVATSSNQTDVMALVQDLQNKLNKLKKENLKLKKDLGQPV